MLTKKQKEVLDFIIDYTQNMGYTPVLEEIQKQFKFASVSTAHFHVTSLKNGGYLARKDNKARSLQLSAHERAIQVRILGTIAAGAPIEAIETYGETISLSKNEIPANGKHYALRVSGDSMIEDGIFDGDVVVIKEQQTAENGQTVVAIIDDNQATLKKIYQEKNRFRLQPANQNLLPFYRTNVEIRGVVIKIIRELESANKNEGELQKLVKKMPPTLNVQRQTTSQLNEKAKPFIQWVGGKREMIAQYQHLIPKKFNNYYEPFLGGGAMYFNLQPKKVILSDSNQELIKTYEGVRDNPEDVIKLLRELRLKHSLDLYSKIRNLDREIDIYKQLTSAEIAARMIYLNQTCFNGLYRVNQKGQFNVPIGSSLNRLICDENTLKNASKLLKSAEIKHADFESVTKKAKNNDFIYLDPPYYPISTYSDFTRYTKEKFYQEDQVRLKKEIDRLSNNGCKIMISNSDCEFIRKLYSNYKIHVVYASRSLNSKKDKRGKITELVITNY